MPDASPALKELLGAEPHRKFARGLRGVFARFDESRFLKLTLTGMEERSLTQRLRRTTEALRETLPGEYPEALAILQELAQKLPRSFADLVYPDFVGQYGKDHFEVSLEALKFFTRFGSSEFGIREYLKLDPERALKVMTAWADDPDERVRRLASEGSRPRLPWSFRLEAIVKDPTLTAPILAKLIDDPSLYVRKSVSNHLNDISKDHPEWLIRWLQGQNLSRPHAKWIAKRALRTLIKNGHAGALALVGVTGKATLDKVRLAVNPRKVRLGDSVNLSARLRSSAAKSQHLVVDYVIHYVKNSGASARKVFKWKVVDLGPGALVELKKDQRIKDFTTRKHYSGKHAVDLLVNGQTVARAGFDLKC